MAFSFTVVPFIVLTLSASFTVWMRVYFYCIVGVAAAMGFFASPGKAWLRKMTGPRPKPAATTSTTSAPPTPPLVGKDVGLPDVRRLGDELSDKLGVDVRPAFGRSESREDVKGASLGLPEDPMQDLDEIMRELRKEVQSRRDRGQSIGQGLQEAVQVVQAKAGELKRMQEESAKTK